MDLPFSLQQLVLWSGVFSLAALAVTIATVPWVIGRLPADYFSREQRQPWRVSAREPWYALVLGLLKNLLGAVLVAMGVVMLFTPGQGLLTLLAGLLLMNFPGKYRLECSLARRPGMLRGMNWLRRRRGEPPFTPPPG